MRHNDKVNWTRKIFNTLFGQRDCGNIFNIIYYATNFALTSWKKTAKRMILFISSLNWCWNVIYVIVNQAWWCKFKHDSWHSIFPVSHVRMWVFKYLLQIGTFVELKQSLSVSSYKLENILNRNPSNDKRVLLIRNCNARKLCNLNISRFLLIWTRFEYVQKWPFSGKCLV